MSDTTSTRNSPTMILGVIGGALIIAGAFFTWIAPATSAEGTSMPALIAFVLIAISLMRVEVVDIGIEDYGLGAWAIGLGAVVSIAAAILSRRPRA